MIRALRILSLLSALAIILGIVVIFNHWMDSYLIFNLGMLGLAIVYIGNFIVKEKRIKDKENSN